MNWLNIDVSTLRSTEFIGADPVARATWLCLLGYCADQENGGIIKDCLEWGDRRWMQTCAVTKAEIDTSKPLAIWKDTALHVAFYPVSQELKVQANRSNGLKGGRGKRISETEPTENHMDNHMVQIRLNVKERKGKERKEKECKETSTSVPDVTSDYFDKFWEMYPRKTKKPQALKAFKNALKRAYAPMILNGLELHLDSLKKREKQYIPHPATWLNGDCWNDEIVNPVTEQQKPTKPERPIWHACEARCNNWDETKRWCKQFVTEEPIPIESCPNF